MMLVDFGPDTFCWKIGSEIPAVHVVFTYGHNSVYLWCFPQFGRRTQVLAAHRLTGTKSLWPSQILRCWCILGKWCFFLRSSAWLKKWKKKCELSFVRVANSSSSSSEFIVFRVVRSCVWWSRVLCAQVGVQPVSHFSGPHWRFPGVSRQSQRGREAFAVQRSGAFSNVFPQP